MANFIQSNIFVSLSFSNVLHIVFIAVIAALASRRIAAAHRITLLGGAHALNALLMQTLGGVLLFAPVGVRVLVYAGLAGMDWAGVFQLRAFVWAVGLVALLHSVVILPGLYRVRARRSPWVFASACRVSLLTALLFTASSTSTLPVSMRALEVFGVSERVVSFSLSLGANLNMDGSCLYQSILLMTSSLSDLATGATA